MNNNTLEFGVSREGNGPKQMIADIRKAQQARYDREDKSLLDALNQANAYLSAQYNLDEEVK
jgi:hypothetical protein